MAEQVRAWHGMAEQGQGRAGNCKVLAGQGRAGIGRGSAKVRRLRRLFLLSVAPQKGTFGAHKKRSGNSGVFYKVVTTLSSLLNRFFFSLKSYM